MSEPKQLKILSLGKFSGDAATNNLDANYISDGGGIRGLSSLEILKRIMYRVGSEMQPPQHDLHPWQYFDLIGGTSPGGIIALMLGRLRMSVDECITEYVALAEKVFSKRNKPPHEEMFDSSRLVEAIKGVVKRSLGDDMEDAPLMDPLGEECCKTVVFTLPHANANFVQPQALRTYHSKHEKPMPCTIWQAARATSAAPTFFEPLVMGSPPRRWIDAGMKFNNPSKAIRSEAGKLWGDINGYMDYNRDIACFLSIGTGFTEIARLDPENLKERVSAKFQLPLAAVKVMKAIASDSETMAFDLENEFHGPIFHRFSVEQGLQAVGLFDYEKIENISVDTTNYLNRRSKAINACVARMVELQPNLGPLAEGPTADSNSHYGRAEQDEVLQRRLTALMV